ncbi:hypothetical protein J6590_070961 [Homalodisca vitripennis]|nr:hypothetical protein J6590_070961 [Homalodisca vitripennis]
MEITVSRTGLALQQTSYRCRCLSLLVHNSTCCRCTCLLKCVLGRDNRDNCEQNWPCPPADKLSLPLPVPARAQ